MGNLHTSSDDEIKQGKTTDIYFVRTLEILKAKGKAKVQVRADVSATSLPRKWPWAILCGVDEIARLFEGHHVNVYSFPEGSVFRSIDHYGFLTPVIVIEGAYGDFCLLETPLLGLICQASGIATKAARVRKLAEDRQLISFGIRRAHPAISPMIDRAAYIGGFDDVSCLTGAQAIGKRPSGTMPHALIIAFGDQAEAWRAFDEVMPKNIPRIALIDTYCDEKTEAIKAVEALGKKLYAVRLDTPRSRRGNFVEIIREIRWELNFRGRKDVKIMVSGGIDEDDIQKLSAAGVDGFGVGSSISAAPPIDFALDIVEKEGMPVAKRGKFGGAKQVWRCPRCLVDIVLPIKEKAPKCPVCNSRTESMLKPLVRAGKIVGKLPNPLDIRRYVLKQLERLSV
jgi:nicotinate phosphoribosyltransferase